MKDPARSMLVLGLLLATQLAGQCTTGWAVGGVAGTTGQVHAALWWDRDGPGPLPAELVLGGEFQGAGTSAAGNLARFDASTGQWLPLGAGTDSHVYALATLPNGDLVVGGDFTHAGGVTCNHVAVWNGNTWSPVGGGTDHRVYALAVMPNGDLIAGGLFANAGGGTVNHIARWDGVAWHALGVGITSAVPSVPAPVTSLAVMANGDLIAAGTFDHAGGTAVASIARWDGANWSPLGAGVGGFSLFQALVSSLTVLPNGELIAGGAFSTAGGLPAQRVARWSGSTWSTMGSGFLGAVKSLTVRSTGELIAASADSNLAVAEWTGTAWSSLAGPGNVETLAASPGGDVAAGGLFSAPGSNVAAWNGSTWAAVGGANSDTPSFDNHALAVSALPNGELVVGGNFTTNGTVPTDSVTRWNGTSWTSMGVTFLSTLPLPYAQINALAATATGDVYVGGYFDGVVGVPGTQNLARWDGATWSPVGGGFGPSVEALLALPGGDVLVGSTSVQRWNGSTWTAIGAPFSGVVRALARLPGGDFVAGGAFAAAGGVPASNLARWNGTSWSPVGGGVDAEVFALTVLQNGDLVVGGHFDFAGGVPTSRIARWDGASWHPFGAGMGTTSSTNSFYDVHALLELPDGDLLAAGPFDLAGGQPAQQVARWNGIGWQAVDGGVGVGSAAALATTTTGRVALTGSFHVAGGSPVSGFAWLDTTCPASAVSYGSGCSGTLSGPANLQATSLPWTGATFTSTATGMPITGICVTVYGLTTASQPLSAALPAAAAGCQLLVAPLVSIAQLPNGGALTTTLPIPSSPSLAGAQVVQQIVAFAIPGGSITEATSSNGLALTLGVF